MPTLSFPRSAEGRTPLHLAALGGHAETATFLLQKGAWAEAYDAQDDTPLHLAARSAAGLLAVLAVGCTAQLLPQPRLHSYLALCMV